MEPRVSFITLGVTDLERAVQFYEKALGLPRLKTPPSVAFFEMGKTWLALWARASLADDAGMPVAGSGFRSFSLAHNVRSPAEVDAVLARVSADGDLEKARAILARKYRAPVSTREEKAKRARFLQSRGFSYEIIRKLLSTGDE